MTKFIESNGFKVPVPYTSPGGAYKYPGYRPQSQRRQAVGSITPGKAFNNFPAIAAAFPDVIAAIINETAEAVGHEAQAAAPVGKGDPRPGTLQESMKIRYARNRATGYTQSARIDFKAEWPKGHRYAWFVEWGTVKDPAHPFLVPAVINNRGTFRAKLHALESRLP